MAKQKILVIEDEPQTLAVMIDILKGSFECTVEGVDNGAKALALLKANDYDLVILDIKLGEINGIDIIETLKKEKPLPDILVVTAWDSRQVAYKVIDAGALDYMTKPVEAGPFVLKVRQILEKKM